MQSYDNNEFTRLWALEWIWSLVGIPVRGYVGTLNTSSKMLFIVGGVPRESNLIFINPVAMDQFRILPKPVL